MVFLEAALRALEQRAPNNGKVTFLDHGPMYRLAFLREFGPEITTSQLYKRWWASLLVQWVAALDLIILLDAPNDILLDRIRARESWHIVKGSSEKEAFEFLTRYRMSFERIIDEPVAHRRVKLLRFDTAEEPVEQIVERILAVFEHSTDNGS